MAFRIERARATFRISKGTKNALLTLLAEGSAIYQVGAWRLPSGNLIYAQTIERMFDYDLVKLTYVNGHRNRHTILLTEIGTYVAQGVLREDMERAAGHGPSRPVSEEAQLFIAEVTA